MILQGPSDVGLTGHHLFGARLACGSSLSILGSCQSTSLAICTYKAHIPTKKLVGFLVYSGFWDSHGLALGVSWSKHHPDKATGAIQTRIDSCRLW